MRDGGLVIRRRSSAQPVKAAGRPARSREFSTRSADTMTRSRKLAGLRAIVVGLSRSYRGDDDVGA
jgi:hypothetical protein